MTSVFPSEVGSQGTFPFEADIKDKTIRCDRRKVCQAKGTDLRKKNTQVTECARGHKIRKKIDADDDR